jgi:hypothetical protein
VALPFFFLKNPVVIVKAQDNMNCRLPGVLINDEILRQSLSDLAHITYLKNTLSINTILIQTH